MPPSDDGLSSPHDKAAVGYRAVPDSFAHLTVSERRTAWAVLRSLTTSLWITLVVTAVTFGAVASYVVVPATALLLGVTGLVGLLALSTALEIKAHDLHR